VGRVKHAGASRGFSPNSNGWFHETRR